VVEGEGRPAGTPTRVFVSYAHESAAHEDAVRELWLLLRRCGVDAQLDKPAAERRQDWPLWMLDQVGQADYVLVVASPAYKRRAEGQAAPDEGRGVQFEAALIREELYRDRERSFGRFLPVLLPGHTIEDIPAWLSPTTTTSYLVAELTEAGIEQLLRVLTGQPWEVAPPLGPVPKLDTRPLDLSFQLVPAGPPAKTALAHELVLEVACEEGQVRCRAVLAGTVISERVTAVPVVVDGVWGVLAGPITAAEQRLAEAGRALREALLDDQAVRELTDLLDHSALGTVVDVVVVADGAALGLPYELLRLPDGRLLATLPGVRLRRQLKGIDRDATRPLAGPLKLLVAVAAPEEPRTSNPPLDVEAEMQAVLDAVGGIGGRGDAQVTILEVGSPEQLVAALRADQYHVLHLSAHGSADGVELEDEDGNPVPVDAASLARQLRAVAAAPGKGGPPPLVVLSSCAGAAGGADSLAATLVRHGVDRVVAMQASVTDSYATRLAQAFYETLASDPVMPVAAALAEARRQVDDERLTASRAGGPLQLPEYGMATVLAADGDPPLQDSAAAPVPLAQPTQAPTGAGVRGLRVGELIGRRRELRTALVALRGGELARGSWGALSGVVLTGVGGIGKTALAGRIQTRLASEGWRTAVHVGRWNPPALSQVIAEALDGDADLARAQALLRDPQVDDTTKLGVVCQLLAKARLLVVLDDFEQNLTTGGGAYHDPGFAEVVGQLVEAADTGQLLITCRYPLPDADPLLLRIDLPPLTQSELGRLLLRLPALRELEPDDRRVVVATIGGHPRLLEFVNALLRQGRANLRDVTTKLRRLAGEHGITLAGRRSLTQAVEEAVLLGSRDIFLDQLLDLVSDEQREVLLQAAVSTLPLSLDDVAVARFGRDPTVPQRKEVATAAERLVDLTLLAPAGDHRVVVHPWIADALGPYQGDQAEQRHRRAAVMRWAQLEAGTVGFGDLVELARHLAASQQFHELVEFATAASDAISRQLGELSVAAFLAEAVPLVSAEVDGFLPLADRETQALLDTGSVAAAVDRATAILTVTRRRAEADPANAEAQRILSISYNKLGDVLRAVGKTAEAERFFRDGLAIRTRLAEADPANALAQRDLSVSYNRLGDVLLTTGQARRGRTVLPRRPGDHGPAGGGRPGQRPGAARPERLLQQARRPAADGGQARRG